MSSRAHLAPAPARGSKDHRGSCQLTKKTMGRIIQGTSETIADGEKQLQEHKLD